MTGTPPAPLQELVAVGPLTGCNVVLVILDCVGAAAISEVAPPGEETRLPAPLRRQFVRFERSVSSASWTLPSHASLLTGLPPWEHGVHGRRGLELPPEVPTLAEALRKASYQTACISANGFLGGSSGLTRGFEVSHLGTWSEVVNRVGRRERSPIQFREGEMPPKGPGEEETGAELGYLLRRMLLRYPGLLDATAHAAHAFAYPEEPFGLRVSPWIEPVFRRWVHGLDAGRPLFCLFNFLDAHEPYYSEGPAVPNFGRWLRYAATSQDQTEYLSRPRSPDDPALRMLRELYLGRIRFLLQRLGTLVEVLQDVHRWDDTLLIVTSDHGQAFGSHGAMFHGLSIDDSVTRVPLWVRFPGGSRGGSTCRAWTSALDVAATVGTCGGSGPGPSPSPDPRVAAGERSVACVSDGVVNLSVMARFPEATRQRLDHVLVAVYVGERKLSYDACHQRFLDDGPPDDGAHETVEGTATADPEAASWAREIGRRMLTSERPRPNRLASWGYE